MRDIDLFQMALGLTPPWQVSDAQFDPNTKRLDIRIDFPRGSTFTCPKCGQTGIKAYDTQEKSWRHLNFFQHDAYLTARVPRIECNDCGTLLIDVPWARPGGKGCPTKNCVADKDLHNCSECNEFPCENLMPVVENAGSARHNTKVYNLSRIKLNGFEAWGEEAAIIQKKYFKGKFVYGASPALEEDA